MRLIPILSLLVFATPMYAKERTWTISKGTYELPAELVEVRGDVAYLKTGDRIEQIPFSRLSAADLKYIDSLAPGLVFPGPADETDAADGQPIAGNVFNALPPGAPIPKRPAPAAQQAPQQPTLEPQQSIAVNESQGPVIESPTPVVERQSAVVESNLPAPEQPVRQPTPLSAPTRYDRAEERLPLPSSGSLSTSRSQRQVLRIDPRTGGDSAVRPPATAQWRYPAPWQNPNASRDREPPREERRGLFGRRLRRLGRDR